MFARSARRKDALRYFKQAADQLQLPFLCPALLRRQVKGLRPRSISTRRPAKDLVVPPRRDVRTRHLASAAVAETEPNDDYVPFTYPSVPNSVSPADSTLSDIPDLRSLLMIDHTTAQPLPMMDRGNPGVEVRGNIHDLESTLVACIHVHRWDRAISLLRQLALYRRSNSYDLLKQYNRVLEAMVKDLVASQNQKHLTMINNWVEVEMAHVGLQPDARTLALKVKAALATLSGTRRERTVRRYWELARRSGDEVEVAGSMDLFNDNDMGKLSEIGVLHFEMEDHDVVEPESTLSLDVMPESTIATKVRDQPGVLETEQKGLGLSTLRKTLSLFSSSDGPKGTAAAQRQVALETGAIDFALERWRAEKEKMSKMGVSPGYHKGTMGALLWQWHELMAGKLTHEFELIQEAEGKAKRSSQEQLRCEYGPHIRQLTPEHLAAVTSIAVLTILSKIGIGTPIKTATLVTELGRMIEMEIEAEKLQQNIKARKAGLAPPYQKISFNYRTSPLSKSFITYGGWGNVLQAKVGAILCELLFECAKVPTWEKDPETGNVQEVFHHSFKRENAYARGKRVGVVSVQPAMAQMLMFEPAGAVIAKQLPMISPPKPWKGMQHGGFLATPTAFLRVKNNEVAQKEYIEAAAERGDLDQLFAGVDVLSRTAWKINEGVFDTMLAAWNSGEAIGNLAPLKQDFDEPTKPTDLATKTQKSQYYRAMRKIEDERAGLHSNRCFQNFQMEIANAYRDEIFYLPHNVDFRGRAYPVPPYLNQMGADNARGLLLFAKGRPLGSSGLQWLKIHLANLYGYDKASMSDREEFTVDHLDDILDSASDPLGGKRWWLGAECQWQCLATCIELQKALKHSNPADFVSHLPVHQDGSCNGLQHYAALGGDVSGAKQVNLEPGDRPADVYTGVAELVKADIRRDAEQGDPLAQLLLDRVTRKIVKQTVMTNVYGVTFLGAIRQVRKQLEDYMPDLADGNKFGQAATYIARKIFKGLGAMFSGAHDIQYWLGDCVYRISSSLSPGQLQKLGGDDEANLVKSSGARQKASLRKISRTLQPGAFRSTIIWTTPLKLPVVQPYRVNKGRRIKTHLQDIILEEPSVADAVNRRKQLQAFPPNFIHSLDATHMVLSALKADELGLTFSAVHDSFWTHAADIDTMSVLLREAFIRMHSEDIIGRLAAEFRLRYKGHLYLANVHSATPLGKALATYRKGLKYKPGSTIHEKRHLELLREIERRKLLASEDPLLRRQGEQMVTAARLYEEHDGDRYLHSRDSLGETAIGAVPQDVHDEAVLKDALASSSRDGDAPQTNVDAVLQPLTVVDTNAAKTAMISTRTVSVDEPSEATSQTETPTTAVKKKKRKATTPAPKQTWLWLPLTFKPVPQKGEWDVKRLRDSTYFFS